MNSFGPFDLAWLVQGIDTTGPPTFCSRCMRMSSEVDIGLCPHCAKVGYCGLRCQVQDWQQHRASCPLLRAVPDPIVYGPLPIVNARQNRLSSNDRLNAYVPRPFTRLVYGIWLHERPPEDVRKLVIDSYRAWVAHRYETAGIVEPGSVYSENPNALTAFRQFVECAAAQPVLLPLHWDDHEMMLTENMAVNTSPEN